MTLLLAVLLFATPADTVHLDWCYQQAEARYPLRQTLALQASITARRLDNLSTRYLPTLSLNGQVTYQSHVPELPLSVPGITPPEISQDQYRISVNVNQLVYDGGVTAQQKSLERVRRELSQQEVHVELYKLRERVNGAYFGVLLAQAQIASLSTLETDLRAKRDRVRAQVEAGAILPSQADVLTAELLTVEQQQAEAEANRRAALATLSELIGQPLPDDAVLVLPEITTEPRPSLTRHRPEYEVFELQRSRLAQQRELEAAQDRPRVSSFVEGSYGRPPGLDIFENSFEPFYTVGIRVNWDLWTWRTGQRDREVLDLQRQAVEAEEATFDKNITLAVQRYLYDIERLDEALRRDDEIIALRERVAEQAASQLENGVITATDYLVERNAVHQARLTRQQHRIQRVQAHVHYLTTLGQP